MTIENVLPPWEKYSILGQERIPHATTEWEITAEKFGGKNWNWRSFGSEGIKIPERKELTLKFFALSFQSNSVIFIVLCFTYAITYFTKVNSWMLLLLVSDRCQMRSVTEFELIRVGCMLELRSLYRALRLKGHMQL